jgi:glucose/arabinose dehydrogenase
MRNITLLVLVLILTAACTPAIPSVEAPATRAAALPTPTPAPGAAAGDATTADPAAEGADEAPPAAVPDVGNIAISLEAVVEGLDVPVFVTHAGDGSNRLFILEKVGRIQLLQDGQVADAPFLDITGQVSLGNEQGLLGLAFAPDFATSGRFFINYTDRGGDTIVARYTVAADDPNRADPASATQILKLEQPAPNHNGGMLAFGPDGMLWIGTGDGGAANDAFGNGQNPDALLGKMLRLDVTSDPEAAYTIPGDNPWVDAGWNGQDVADEVWAVGMRNPWRYSFDRRTGDLWIADVGQNRLEEVNFVAAGSPGGLNFGWPIMEGNSCFRSPDCDPSGLVLPVVDYPHEGHCSVTGGYVYRGTAVPAWDGVYFYGDYCSGVMWAIAPDGAGGWTNAEIARSGLTLSSFGEDEAGELYLADMRNGVVYRMTSGE